MDTMHLILLCLLNVILSDVHCDNGAALRIQLIRYDNPRGHKWQDNNCDPFVLIPNIHKCDHIFDVCVDDLLDANDHFDDCDYFFDRTKEYENDNIVEFGSYVGFTNPLIVNFPEWPGEVNFKVRVYDLDDGTKDDLVDLLAYVIRGTAGRSSSTPWHSVTIPGHQERGDTQIMIEYQIFCNRFYFGPSCSVFCQPQNDDVNGFYICDPHTGEKICRPGKANLANNCLDHWDDCVGHACDHGRCDDGEMSYVCQCYTGYTGDYCETEINHCVSSPCIHGNCSSDITHYTCHCEQDYFGTNCGEHACDEEICINGGRCYGDGQCDCPIGWAGTICEINVCDIMNCRNGGVCVNGSCICPERYVMFDCSLDICDVIICMNGGVCLNGDCRCEPGFTGTHCEENIDECFNNTSCDNDGLCVDGIHGFSCDCLPQFTGELCETVREAANPDFLRDTYPPRYYTDEPSTSPEPPCTEGPCLEIINECESNPCVNGTCINQIGYYDCECSVGFTGAVCNIDVCDLLQCQNNASCVQGRCICEDGFLTNDCSVDMCSLMPCNNGATCTEGVCACADGFTGSHCQENINDCEPEPCEHGGRCVDLVNGFACDCPQNYEGDHCEDLITTTSLPTTTTLPYDPCGNNPCLFGNCTSIITAYICHCSPSYHGRHCDTHVCDIHDYCQHGGVCHDNGLCDCPEGYVGARCEIDKCDIISCENGGTCIDGKCLCPPAYAGSNCGLEICSLTACLNGGTCDVDHCICPEEYTGKHCEIHLGDCLSSPCLNNGICIDTSDGYVCYCTGEFTGLHCESNTTDECQDGQCTTVPALVHPCEVSNTCSNGGSCVPTDDQDSSYMCLCSEEYVGEHCELSRCTILNCKNNASCLMGKCECSSGYIGNDCSIDLCLLTPCVHGATCLEGVCICPPEYTGQYCSDYIDNCTPDLCMNGGSCINQRNGYVCLCTGMWLGNRCEIDGAPIETTIPTTIYTTTPTTNPTTNPTTIPTTQQRATTRTVVVTTTATTASPQTTTTSIEPCQNNPCDHGSCQDMNTASDALIQHCLLRTDPFDRYCALNPRRDFFCLCEFNFLGELCETNVCDSDLDYCSNGGTCQEDGSCVCAEGYFGPHCTVDGCSFIACHNGAECSSGRCQCIQGYAGSDCSFDECDLKTCLNGATCTEGSCECSTGFSGDHCETSEAQNNNQIQHGTTPAAYSGGLPEYAESKKNPNSTKIPMAVFIGVLGSLIALILIALLLLLLRRLKRKPKSGGAAGSRAAGDGESLYDNPVFGPSTQHTNPTYDTATIPTTGGIGAAMAVGGKKRLFVPTKLDMKSDSLSEDPEYDTPFSKERPRLSSISGNPYDRPLARQSSLVDSLSDFPVYDTPKFAIDTDNAESTEYYSPKSLKHHPSVANGGGTMISVGPDDKKIPL